MQTARSYYIRKKEDLNLSMAQSCNKIVSHFWLFQKQTLNLSDVGAFQLLIMYHYVTSWFYVTCEHWLLISSIWFSILRQTTQPCRRSSHSEVLYKKKLSYLFFELSFDLVLKIYMWNNSNLLKFQAYIL